MTELLEATAIGVDHSAPITQVQCDDWGITAGDVRAAATDNLAVAGDEDLVVAILDNTLTIIQEKSDMLCPVPFLVAGDRVEIWEPAAGHPAAELVHRTHDLFPHH